MAHTMNREQWLTEMVSRLVPTFEEAGHIVPKVAVSCGFPSRGAMSNQSRRIGECWYPEASQDGTTQIFVSPAIGDGVRAADILVHELCHSVLPKAKHNKTFAALATRMGLEGKPTATVAGKALVERLNVIVKKLGPYPHAGMSIIGRDKKQTTRLLKASCATCGYTVRVTSKWLDLGTPICPLDHESMEVEA